MIKSLFFFHMLCKWQSLKNWNPKYLNHKVRFLLMTWGCRFLCVYSVWVLFVDSVYIVWTEKRVCLCSAYRSGSPLSPRQHNSWSTIHLARGVKPRANTPGQGKPQTSYKSLNFNSTRKWARKLFWIKHVIVTICIW